MLDILQIFNDQVTADCGVALLPTNNLLIDKPFKIGTVWFAPPDMVGGLSALLASVDDRAFIPINAQSDELVQSEMKGDSLRRFSSKLSGIEKSVIENSTIAVCPVVTDWEAFETANHVNDISLLEQLSSKADRSLDLVRIQFCQLGLPDTVPGIPGYWDRATGAIGAAIISPNGRGKLIGGIKSAIIPVGGLGLELNEQQIDLIPSGDCARLFKVAEVLDEISLATRYALELFSRAMYANSDTLKFIMAIALLEYLGSGETYVKFEVIRKALQPHLAKTSADYDRLSIRFQELTSMCDGGKNVGYRHRIIHEGRLLEELAPSPESRRQLFRELDGFIGKVIVQMSRLPCATWDSLATWRKKRTAEILGAI